MIQMGVQGNVQIGGSGLTPGTKVRLSTVFTPTGSQQQSNAGFEPKTVKNDGTVTYSVGYEEISPSQLPGQCRAWFRDDNIQQNPGLGEPIGVDAVIEFNLPLEF